MLAAEQWPAPAEDDGDGRGEEASVVGNGGGETTAGKKGGDRRRVGGVRRSEGGKRREGAGKGAEIVGITTTEREWRRGSNDGWPVTEAEEGEEGGEGGGVTVAAATKNREEKAGDGGEVKRKGKGVQVRRGRSVAFGGQKGEAEKGQGRRTVEGGTIGDGNGRKKMEEQRRRVTVVEAMAVTTNKAGDDHDEEKRRKKGRGGGEKPRGKKRRGGKKALGAVLHRARLRVRGRCAPRVVARAHMAVSGHTPFFFFFYQDVTERKKGKKKKKERGIGLLGGRHRLVRMSELDAGFCQGSGTTTCTDLYREAAKE